ncbi:MAG: DUF3568 family protein [Deltaproteobacteria bacterium]|nr:DUF3568 family protein [Deltaproteobacteria bacterium]
MKIRQNVWIPIVLACFLSAGCAPLIAGGAAVTAGTGTYFFVNGELKTDYLASFDDTWKACEKTVAAMKAVDVAPNKEISEGSINAVINDEKVRINVVYKSRNKTTVGIRVGLVGDQQASQYLHDRVTDFLSKQ